jgi:hypothetical protein
MGKKKVVKYDPRWMDGWMDVKAVLRIAYSTKIKVNVSNCAFAKAPPGG